MNILYYVIPPSGEQPRLEYVSSELPAPPGFAITPAMVVAFIQFMTEFPKFFSELGNIWGSGEASPEAIAAFKTRLLKLAFPDGYYATPPKP